MRFEPAEFWSFRQHLLNLHFPIVGADSEVEVFPELVKCAEINSDRTVKKMPLTFLILQTEEHMELTENHLHIYPKQQKGDDRGINACTYLRPVCTTWTYLRLFKTRQNPCDLRIKAVRQ